MSTQRCISGLAICHLRDRLSKVGGDGCTICDMVMWCLNVYCLDQNQMVYVCGSWYDICIVMTLIISQLEAVGGRR